MTTSANYWIRFTLQSDAAFGRGDGIAGLVNQEVQHDEYGCPFLGGKAIKGMLVNECADILAALPTSQRTNWEGVALALFGQPGSEQRSQAKVSIGDAMLPQQLRQAIQTDIDSSLPTLTPAAVLNYLTTVRHQTAISQETGAATDATLRTIRVVLRQTIFEAPIWVNELTLLPAAERQTKAHDPAKPTTEQLLMLLSACLMAFRRVGTYRNRGLGRLEQVQLCNQAGEPIGEAYFKQFCEEVQP